MCLANTNNNVHVRTESLAQSSCLDRGQYCLGPLNERLDENDCSGYSADDLTLVILHLGDNPKLSLER